MASMEAGIRYRLQFRRTQALPEPRVRELIAWRQLLHQTQLIGREPGTFGRYGGIGYGNLSH